MPVYGDAPAGASAVLTLLRRLLWVGGGPRKRPAREPQASEKRAWAQHGGAAQSWNRGRSEHGACVSRARGLFLAGELGHELAPGAEDARDAALEAFGRGLLGMLWPLPRQ